MNDLIFADQELEVGFIGKLDALLEGIERMGASQKVSLGNEQFLTDKEVSAWLKVSRRTLQDYRNNGMIAYYLLGGKILYKESDIEKLVMSGYRNAYRLETGFNLACAKTEQADGRAVILPPSACSL